MSGLYELNGLAPTTPETGDYWIAPGAHVIGDVDIAAAVGIWFNVAIRGDNERIAIGEGSNVQEGVVMHTDPGFPLTVGAGCTIGHKAMLHGCSLGDNTLVGMSATILNGARIGANCLVGAGALVTEGKVFEDGSLIMGAPAKAVRKLDDAAIQGLRASALHYQERMRVYRAGLKPV